MRLENILNEKINQRFIMLYKLKTLFLVATASFCMFSMTSNSLEAYKKKTAYEGYGKVSETTKRVKTKTVSGYTKKDGTYVQPYAKS
jgi:hypothetical protein